MERGTFAKVKAETQAATVLRFKCFLLPFHPSLSLAQITLSLLCQRILPPSSTPLPFVRLPLFSSMQISFRKWKFFRDIVKTSVRRPRSGGMEGRRGSWLLALNGNKMHDWSDRHTEREAVVESSMTQRNSRPTPELSLRRHPCP